MHQYTGTAARERLLEISNFAEAQLGPERIEIVSRIPLDFLEPTLPLIIRERVDLHTSYGDEIPVIMCYPEDAGGKTQYPVIMCLPVGLGREDALCPVTAGMSAHEACRGIYRTYGASEHLKLRIEPRGHNRTKDTLTAIRDFFGESMS